jgi:hypothetical protein
MNPRHILLVVFFIVAASIRAADIDRYLSQTLEIQKISPDAKPLIEELRTEIQKILDAGPLAPLRTVYADLEQDPYFLYWQPGRIVTTLALAYPHCTPDQQTAIQKCVHSELDDPARAPWTQKGFIPPDNGARRELHTFNQPLGWDRYWAMWGHNKPTVSNLYGLWLYARNTNDWEALQKHYPKIVSFYNARSKEADLYGTMSAHVAMYRIARHFKDAQAAAKAADNARSAFAAAADFDQIEARARKYYKERYEPRQLNLVYQGWIFIDLAPEIARFIDDNAELKEKVLARHQQGLEKYPLFWLREVPYWSRWTGDEGLGIPTELAAMLHPVARHVAHTDPKALAVWTKSTPICVGDCYWLEMLIDAIESTGQSTWTTPP